MTNMADQSQLKLRSAVSRLRALAAQSASTDVLSDLQAAERRLSEPKFKLLILGEYKRGKTTLINALLGAPALPTAVVPLTSVLTEVTYGQSARARVEFLNGQKCSMPLSDLAEYVTEPGNPNNEKGVARAFVEHPSELLARGVTIVDTPGIGSVFEHNSEVTYRALDEADAVVVVLAADQPLSAEERSLLRALRGITDRILFAVNRIDILSLSEADSSLKFIRETLTSLEDRRPEFVTPLSARVALAARTRGEPDPGDFAHFDRVLRKVLIERKSEILFERATTLARKAIDTLTLEFRSEQRSVRLARHELHQAAARFRASQADLDRRLQESGVLLKHRVNEIPTVELAKLGTEARARIQQILWPKIKTRLEESTVSPATTVAQLASDIGDWVVAELRDYYPSTERVVNTVLGVALREHTDRVQEAVRELIATANELLGMRANVPEIVPPTLAGPRFYLRDWDYTGGFGGGGWRLRLPRRWADRYARQALHELLERRINQNLETIRNDWMTRLDDAVRSFQDSARKQASALFAILAAAMERAERLEQQGAAPSRLDVLDRLVSELDGIRNDLESAARRAEGDSHDR